MESENIFIKGKTYKLILEVDGIILKFTATITKETNLFFEFIDRNGDIFGYNKEVIKSYRNIKNG